ncbi:MAG: DUF1844 domain-containing protein [Pirellulales bacterium]|nr:DUF1844 domain-containing protein [Pirellulales bacterium]
MSQEPPPSKILVDEDWKSQVQAEKARIRGVAGGTDVPDHGGAVPLSGETPTGDAPSPVVAPADSSPPESAALPQTTEPQSSTSPAGKAPPPTAADATRQFPPASLAFLINTLATQALMALGDIPHPLTGQATRDLPAARHYIDTLEILEEKTSGNRTPEESNILRNWLYQLRLAFVEESRGG